jgi:hypothetical protein
MSSKKIWYLALAFALLVAGAGGQYYSLGVPNSSEGEAKDVITVEFTGVAVELYEGEMPGAPTIWAVEVTSDEAGAISSDIVYVTVYQSTPPPWGTYDDSVTVGDTVEVYGAYVEDETGSTVTLQGSEEYYFKPSEEEVGVADEVEIEEEDVCFGDACDWEGVLESIREGIEEEDVCFGDACDWEGVLENILEEVEDEDVCFGDACDWEDVLEHIWEEVGEETEIFDCTCRDVAWGDSWEDKSKEQPL